MASRLPFQVALFLFVFFLSVYKLSILTSPAVVKKDEQLKQLGTYFFDKSSGLPSVGCHQDKQVALIENYVNHWRHAYRILQQHAPEEVLEMVPELANGTDMFSDKNIENALRAYLKRSYAVFFPGFTMIRPSKRSRQRAIYYSRVWKAGNDAIRCNLGEVAQVKPYDYHRSLRTRRHMSSTTKVVTFVREPSERWVAGYNELETRWMIERTYNVTDKCPKCIFPSLTGQTRVWGFLTDLITMKLQNAFEIEHVYPESGIFRGMNKLDFVGRIENFDSDWNKFVREYFEETTYRFNTSLGFHNSSMDMLGAKENGMTLLENSVPFAQILQHMLFKDYKCFGYPWRVPLDSPEEF